MAIYETKYFGIDILVETRDGLTEHWICGGRNGEEQYFGKVRPTEQDVIDYRNRLLGI